MKTATVQRSKVILHPDRSRVLLRPFLPPTDPRAARICAQVNAPTRYCLEPEQVPSASCEKNVFERKLQELGLVGDFSRQVLLGLGDSFTLDDLRASLSRSAQQFLARDDPTKLIGRLREPLIKPNENEREGYVPNVVYSCGSLLHGRQFVIPYAMSDYAATFATLSLDDVLSAME